MKKTVWRRDVETVPGPRPSLKTCAYHPCNDKQVLVLSHVKPSEDDKVKEKCTRPKDPLKDINLPPLQRQIGTSPTKFRKQQWGVERRRQGEAVKKSSGHVTRPQAFLNDPCNDKFGSAGSPRAACPTSVPERLELCGEARPKPPLVFTPILECQKHVEGTKHGVLATFGRRNVGIYAVFCPRRCQTLVNDSISCTFWTDFLSWWRRYAFFKKSKIVTWTKPCK